MTLNIRNSIFLLKQLTLRHIIWRQAKLQFKTSSFLAHVLNFRSYFYLVKCNKHLQEYLVHKTYKPSN